MTAETGILLMTAFSAGFLHTILGPDHYIPFVAMAKSNDWSIKKTFAVTFLCGLGHVLSSALIGAVGLVVGAVLLNLESLESFRGDSAAWLLIGFGLAYLTWGIVRAVRNVPHTHLHSYTEGTNHVHEHRHDLEHRHDQLEKGEVELDETAIDKSSMAAWILFLIFLFGPCEVLIPLLMYPAAESNWLAVLAVVALFSAATIGTMMVSVAVLFYGLRLVRWPDMHRFGHAFAGLAVLMCGVLVKLGL